MGDAGRSHELVGSVAGDGMHWIPSAETMHWLAVLCAYLQQNVFSTKTVNQGSRCWTQVRHV